MTPDKDAWLETLDGETLDYKNQCSEQKHDWYTLLPWTSKL